MQTPEQYEARWFRESDLGAYIEGLNRTLYYDYSERLFRWKFGENPNGLGFPTIAVVEHIPTGRPVAFNSFLPMRVRRGDDCFTILQGCDGFVDEAHRRQGLFQTTLNFMAEEMRGRSPEILIGFNLVEAAGAARKAGSALAHDVDRCVMERSVLKGFRDREGVTLEPIDQETLSGLYEEWAAGSPLLHIHRSLPYTRWYNRNPLRSTQTYQVHGRCGRAGYLVVDEIEEGGQLGLTMEDYPPGMLSGGLLRGILAHLCNANPSVATIDIYTQRGDALEPELAGLGFSVEPWFKVIMKALNVAVQEGGRVLREGLALSDTSNWHLTAGDIY
jgi:GNAT superfamily N-acetyltransferase